MQTNMSSNIVAAPRPTYGASGARARTADDLPPIVTSSTTSGGSTATPAGVMTARVEGSGRGASRGRIERFMRRHGIRAIMEWPCRVMELKA